MSVLESNVPARVAVLLCLVASRATGLIGGPASAVNPMPAPYTGDMITAHCAQTYHLFQPQGQVEPPCGWPVLIHLDISGFTQTNAISVITPGSSVTHDILAGFLDNGIAVITARATLSLPAGHPLWNTACGAAAPATLPGDGLFHPPGAIPPDLMSPPIEPYTDPAYSMAEKDASMLIQHVRYNGGRPGHLLARIDRTRIAVHGNSAGAISLSWPAYGPDRSAMFAGTGWGGQYTEKTRVDAALLRQGVVWWKLFDPTFPVPSHFGQGGLSTPGNTTMGEADQTELVESSAVFYEDCPANDVTPFWLWYGETFDCMDFTKDPAGCNDPTVDFDCAGNLESGGLHPAWSGFVWETLHPNNTFLALRTQALVDLATTNGLQATLVPGSAAAIVSSMQSWTAANFTGVAPTNAYTEQWTDMGFALPGAGGTPVLCLDGTLEAESTTRFLVRNAPASTIAYVIIGYSQVNIPFWGGTLVPSPDIIPIVTLPTSVDGEISGITTWPAGVLPGTEIYFHVWMPDAGGPLGFSATNAMRAVAP